MKTGIELIAKERKRQVEEEGWDANHDSKWIFGELARAAGAYANDAGIRIKNKTWGQRHLEYVEAHPDWPWAAVWWKATPDDDIRQLVKAGALIAAEVDRLQRTETIKSQER